MSVSKKFFVGLFLFLAIRAVLDYSYIYFVNPYYEYAGFNLFFDENRYIISWILYLTVLPLTPTKLLKVSDAVFMLVSTSIIAPITSMYGLSSESIIPVLMSVLSVWLIFIIVNVRFLTSIRLPCVRMGERVAVIFALALVAVIAMHYLAAGVHFNFDLAKVYDFRLENELSAGGGVFAYLNPWAFQVFNLFLIAVFLRKRRYGIMMLLFLVQVFFFAASQQKSVLFAPFVVVGIWWFLRKSNNLLIVPVSLLIMMIGSLLIFHFFDDLMTPSIAIRRIFFVPAHLSFTYYDFFTTHPKVVWGDSFWMPLHSPYPVSIPSVIGAYLGYPDMHANNGYVSSGFAQAGFFGVFLYTLILGYILKFVDRWSRQLNAIWFGVGLFLLPFMTIWRSSDLATSMLTHGLLLMLVLLWLLRRPIAEKNSVVRTHSLTPQEQKVFGSWSDGQL